MKKYEHCTSRQALSYSEEWKSNPLNMEKRKRLALMSVFCISILTLFSPGVNADCLFNGAQKTCEGNSGLGRTPLSKGSDLDIYWGDGEVTTIRFLSRKNGPASKGDPVVINGKIKGWVLYNRDIRPGVFELGFKSSTGNTFAVQLGD